MRALLWALPWVLPAAVLFPADAWAQSKGRKVGRIMRFHVDDYGAAPNRRENSEPAFRQAIRDASQYNKKAGEPVEIVLGSGTYRLHADEKKQCAIILWRLKNLKFQGQKGKTHLVFTDPMKAGITLNGCENSLVGGFTMDWDPLPFTAGVIEAADVNNATFDLEIFPYRDLLDEPRFSKASSRWGMLIHPTEQHPKSCGMDHLFIGSWEKIGPRTYRLKAAEKAWRVKYIQPGDRWYQLARGYGGGIAVNNCKDCAVEDVTVYSSPSCASSVGNSEGVVIRRLEVRLKPGEKRILSTNADGVHCHGNVRGPLIEDCYFEGMADDATNMYCRPNIVKAVHSADDITVSDDMRLEAGNRVQAFDPRAGRLLGETVVASAQRDERGKTYRLRLRKGIDGLKGGGDFNKADHIYNVDRSGHGFVIRNNTMTNFRGRGILVRAGGGLIEGNTVDRVSSMGIVVSNEPDWPEGPLANGTIVRNNTVTGVGFAGGWAGSSEGASIQILTKRLGWKVAEGRGLSNITIEKNTIIDPCRWAIYAGSVDGVTIKDNKIRASEKSNAWGDGAGVCIENCTRAVIQGLDIEDPRGDTKAAILIKGSTGRGEEQVKISGTRAKLAAGVPEVQDQR